MTELRKDTVNKLFCGHKLNSHAEIIVSQDDGYSIAVLSSDVGSNDPEDDELIFEEIDSTIYMFNGVDEQ